LEFRFWLSEGNASLGFPPPKNKIVFISIFWVLFMYLFFLMDFVCQVKKQKKSFSIMIIKILTLKPLSYIIKSEYEFLFTFIAMP